jgi:hypothetical protein
MSSLGFPSAPPVRLSHLIAGACKRALRRVLQKGRPLKPKVQPYTLHQFRVHTRRHHGQAIMEPEKAGDGEAGKRENVRT